ncbi:tripeptidyl-peptidase II Tpp2 [Branchiostoma belcheri]|nr:tripeptidyl-peptidase II Tpp2 [Branchiostoma belcheri]
MASLPEETQKALDSIVEWGESYSLGVNGKKTMDMVISARKEANVPVPPHPTIAGYALPSLSSRRDTATLRTLQNILQDSSSPLNEFLIPPCVNRYCLRREGRFRATKSRTKRHELSFVSESTETERGKRFLGSQAAKPRAREGGVPLVGAVDPENGNSRAPGMGATGPGNGSNRCREQGGLWPGGGRDMYGAGHLACAGLKPPGSTGNLKYPGKCATISQTETRDFVRCELSEGSRVQCVSQGHRIGDMTGFELETSN